MSSAVVPIKSLADGKSRLLPHFRRDQLEALSLAMLEDVVVALLAAPSIDRVIVVTPDERVAAASREVGAEVVLRPEPGLNAAIDAGTAYAADQAPGAPVLTVLGDVAGALPEEVEQLFGRLQELGGRGAVLAPSSDGGSSALLRAPGDVLPSHFGPESGKAHREAASERGVPWAELPLPSLAIDLDCAEDLEHFAASKGGGRATRAVLAQLGVGATD